MCNVHSLEGNLSQLASLPSLSHFQVLIAYSIQLISGWLCKNVLRITILNLVNQVCGRPDFSVFDWSI